MNTLKQQLVMWGIMIFPFHTLMQEKSAKKK